MDDCVFFAYTLTNTVKLGAHIRIRDPDILTQNRIQLLLGRFLNFFSNYDADQSERAGNIS